MLKKTLPLLLVPLLLAGCATSFTNLTPQQTTRNPNNLYSVEVALSSRRETLRWDSLRPQVLVGNEVYPMRPTPLMTNRWEGLLPVRPGQNTVQYRFKFDFDYNTLGKPKSDSVASELYTLQILESKEPSK